MGCFADWQPRYEAYGIRAFPVSIDRTRNLKKPLWGNPQKMGFPASRSAAARHPDAAQIGFWAGSRNKLTVLDVDVPDRSLLDERLRRHGPTPLIVETATGKFHAYYRHNGEKRIQRHDGEPVDILGSGLVVLPPTQVDRNCYRVIEGSFDDLERLPVMQGIENSPAAGSGDALRVGKPWSEMGDGDGRNETLQRDVARQAHHCSNQDQLLLWASEQNAGFGTPLPDTEVVKMVHYWWGKTISGENRCGVGHTVQISHDQIDRLMKRDPDAFLLLIKLRRHHWGRPNFVMANSMAETMPGGGWPRKRFAAARLQLEMLGEVEKVRAHSKQSGPALYRFPPQGGQK